MGSTVRPALRSGFTVAEGSVDAPLVLERVSAGARSARRTCPRPILGFAQRILMPAHLAAGWGGGDAVLAAARSIARSIAPASSRAILGRIVSGASGAVEGDRLEAHTSPSCVDGGTPAVLVPKSITGQRHGGGFPAAAVLAASADANSRRPPTLPPDPGAGRDTWHPGGSLACVGHHAGDESRVSGAASWPPLERP